MLHGRRDLPVLNRHLSRGTEIAALEVVNIESWGRRVLSPSDLNGQRQRLTKRCPLRVDSGVDTHLRGPGQRRADKPEQQAQGKNKRMPFHSSGLPVS